MTLIIVMSGWVFFRADSLTDALTMISAMFTPDTKGISPSFAVDVTSWSLCVMFIGALLALIQGLRQHLNRLEGALSQGLLPNIGNVLSLPIFLLALSSLIASNYSPFLYFQF